jgi:hypothetical protein
MARVCSPEVDATDALDRLLRVSEDIRAAVVFERGGDTPRVLGSTVDEDARELADLGEALLRQAARLRDSAEARRLEAVTPDGSVYLVRDGERAVIATAAPGALVGLVQHDLQSLLAELSNPRAKARAAP